MVSRELGNVDTGPIVFALAMVAMAISIPGDFISRTSAPHRDKELEHEPHGSVIRQYTYIHT